MNKTLSRIIDWLSPWCPSGLNHRATIGIVTNCNGHQYCWHRDCMRANTAEVTHFVGKEDGRIGYGS